MSDITKETISDIDRLQMMVLTEREQRLDAQERVLLLELGKFTLEQIVSNEAQTRIQGLLQEKRNFQQERLALSTQMNVSYALCDSDSIDLATGTVHRSQTARNAT